MYTENYGLVKEIRTKAEIVLAGKSRFIVAEGDVIDVDFKSLIAGRGGCTGKILFIDAKQFVIDCSTLFFSDVVTVNRDNIASIGFAENSNIRDMYDRGGKYL